MAQSTGLIIATLILMSGPIGIGALVVSLRKKSVRSFSAEQGQGLKTA